jgi:hypothetical protein
MILITFIKIQTSLKQYNNRIFKISNKKLKEKFC